jgi:putative DNA primase/helicase
MARERDRGLIVGRLLAYGAAPYQFRASEDASFYVRVQTQRGERVLWGKDLARAIVAAATQPKIGDMVGARRIGREPVTVVARASQAEQQVHRNRWIVEKAGFFAERSRLARQVRDAQADTRRAVQSQPELLSTYLTLRGAQELAEKRIADPKDRERFVALVREAMAGSIQKGQPLPSVRLRERDTPSKPNKPVKDEPTR